MPDLLLSSTNSSFFFGGSFACVFFLYGLAANLYVFQKKNIPYTRVMDISLEETVAVGDLVKFATLLTITLLNLYLFQQSQLVPFFYDKPECCTVFFSLLVYAIICMPFDIWKKKTRGFLLRTLRKCLWPFRSFQLPPSETPFVEVFVADGLTSMSKMLQDLSIAILMCFVWLSHDDPKSYPPYQTRMKHHPLPYFVASIPYIIRANQCIISYRNSRLANDQFLHVLNTCKYTSSLLVIIVGSFPLLFGSSKYIKQEGNNLFILCAAGNSLYSFFWDIVMDWGLLQPNLETPKNRFLRDKLAYRSRFVYYFAVVIDFCLRILWVAKWYNWDTKFRRWSSYDFKTLAELAEIFRRSIWNCFRIEWQCIKLDLLKSEEVNSDEEASVEKIEARDLIYDETLHDTETSLDSDEEPLLLKRRPSIEGSK